MADELSEILRAADKHPNSRVSKLIRTVQEEPCQKNIVLLLVDLAEHAEYSIDFAISLKYYLNLFEEMGLNHDMILNEAGLLLIHSSKIYAKRVDHVFALVERQILSLSKADQEMEKKKKRQEEEESPSNETSNEKDTGLERKRGGRKRALDDNLDPYEIELIPKKIRILNADKRFNLSQKNVSTTTTTLTKVNKTSHSRLENDQYLHPACWLYGTIYDLENEEEFDSKRNYKLFTYHIEHRYNTLVPDINFRLHFKVKDFLEAEADQRVELGNEEGRIWPPLSQAYVQQYIDLENHILNKEKPVQTSQSSTNFEVRNRDKESAIITSETLLTADADATAEASASSDANSLINVNESENLGLSSIENSGNNNNTSQISETLNEFCELSTTENATPNDTQNSSLNKTLNNTLESTIDNGNLQETEHTLNESSNLMENESQNQLTESQNETGPQDNNTATEESQSQSHSVEASDVEKNQTANGPEDNSIVASSDASKSVELEMQDKKLMESQPMENDDCKINLNEIRIHLPHHDDEGVYFSDLDENEQRMLSPKVIATDILPLIPNKENITIVIDAEIRSLLNLGDDHDQSEGAIHLPITVKPNEPELHFNIFQIPEKYFKKKVLFKLGTEMDLYMKARLLKRARGVQETCNLRLYRQLKLFPLNNTDISDIYLTPMQSPAQSDFLGFTDNEDFCRMSVQSPALSDFLGFTDKEDETNQERRLTLDSGVDVVTAGNGNQKKTQNNGECEDNGNKVSGDKENPADLNASEIVQNLTTTDNENSERTLIAENESQEENLQSQMTLNATHLRNTELENSDYVADNTELTNMLPNDDDFRDIEIQSNKTKIQQWHDNLRPILAKSRDRHHFDVFQLGTEIIETIQSHSHSRRDENETLENCDSNYRSSSCTSTTFMDIMREKDKSYVSRYFLSTLLLVNQNNIELSLKQKSSEKPTDWNDLHMKLKSTKRYTVAIEDNIGLITTTVNTNVNVSPNNTENQTPALDTETNNKESRERKAQKRSSLSTGDKLSYSKMRILQRLEKERTEQELNSNSINDDDFADHFKEPSQATQLKGVNALITSTPLNAKRKAYFQSDEVQTPKQQALSKDRLSETILLTSSRPHINRRSSTNSKISALKTKTTPAQNSKCDNSCNITSPPNREINLNTSSQSSDQPTTSLQAKRMETLQYNCNAVMRSSPLLLLNSIKPLKPIQKAPQQSDDYDSGIYSNDDYLIPVLPTTIS
ncbi:chromosome associated protein H2 isoform 1-T1 [Glossina fuscipes fuscipes]